MKELSFFPSNRHLLLQSLEESGKKEKKKDVSILLPEDYKEEIAKPFGAYKVLKVALGSQLQHVKDKIVMVENHMVQKLQYEGEEILLVQDNHVLGFFMKE